MILLQFLGYHGTPRVVLRSQIQDRFHAISLGLRSSLAEHFLRFWQLVHRFIGLRQAARQSRALRAVAGQEIGHRHRRPPTFRFNRRADQVELGAFGRRIDGDRAL